MFHYYNVQYLSHLKEFKKEHSQKQDSYSHSNYNTDSYSSLFKGSKFGAPAKVSPQQIISINSNLTQFPKRTRIVRKKRARRGFASSHHRANSQLPFSYRNTSQVQISPIREIKRSPNRTRFLSPLNSKLQKTGNFSLPKKFEILRKWGKQVFQSRNQIKVSNTYFR